MKLTVRWVAGQYRVLMADGRVVEMQGTDTSKVRAEIVAHMGKGAVIAGVAIIKEPDVVYRWEDDSDS